MLESEIRHFLELGVSKTAIAKIPNGAPDVALDVSRPPVYTPYKSRSPRGDRPDSPGHVANPRSSFHGLPGSTYDNPGAGMLNILAKCLLALTSLSPVLLTSAVNQLERGESWTIAGWPILAAILLAVFCKLLLRYAKDNAQKYKLHIKEFESKDQEMLTFLFIYLLPFVRGSTFATEWLTSIMILAIIIIAIAIVGAFHFNPLMRLLFCYRFYAIKDRHGVSCLLIGKIDLRRPCRDIATVRLADRIYLHSEPITSKRTGLSVLPQ